MTTVPSRELLENKENCYIATSACM